MKRDDKIDILVVGDRLEGLQALESVLHESQFNLVRSASGSEVLQHLGFCDFAVILLNVEASEEQKGFETAEIINKVLRYQQTPIIFITDYIQDDISHYQGDQWGLVDFIFKPFDPQILLSKVNIFVDLFIKSKQLRLQNKMIYESERRERDLKLAELEVESLKRYRNLADAIPHIVLKARVSGTVDYFNKVWTDYTGLSPEQSEGSRWQSAIHTDDLKKLLDSWMNAVSTHQSFEAECRIRRADGQMRWFWIQITPETWQEHQIVAWLGTGTDIHDRKQSEAKIIEAEKIAISASMAKTQFLANMSHEIRTPLNAILGFAELILTPHQTEEERIYSASTIRRSGHQLMKIIDEILDISKVEAGGVEVENILVNPELNSEPIPM